MSECKVWKVSQRPDTRSASAAAKPIQPGAEGCFFSQYAEPTEHSHHQHERPGHRVCHQAAATQWKKVRRCVKQQDRQQRPILVLGVQAASVGHNKTQRALSVGSNKGL